MALPTAVPLPPITAHRAGCEEMVMDWKPIDTAPKDGTKILIWRKGRLVKIAKYVGPESEWVMSGWVCQNGNYQEPTFWCAIEPPVQS